MPRLQNLTFPQPWALLFCRADHLTTSRQPCDGNPPNEAFSNIPCVFHSHNACIQSPESRDGHARCPSFCELAIRKGEPPRSTGVLRATRLRAHNSHLNAQSHTHTHSTRRLDGLASCHDKGSGPPASSSSSSSSPPPFLVLQLGSWPVAPSRWSSLSPGPCARSRRCMPSSILFWIGADGLACRVCRASPPWRHN